MPQNNLLKSSKRRKYSHPDNHNNDDYSAKTENALNNAWDKNIQDALKRWGEEDQ